MIKIVIVEICPVCGRKEFYLHIESHTKREYMSCAYCGNEKTTKNPQLEIEKKEKLQRMDDLKNGKGGVNNPVEGDPRFPEKPAWVIRDEKRMEETKKMIYNGKEVKVPKPYYID